MGFEPNMLGGTFGIIVVVFVFLLLILWTLLPFAIFGIKGRLDELITLNRSIRDELSKLNVDVTSLSESEEQVPEPPKMEPVPPPSVQICENCGQKNSQRMTNCTNCGRPLKIEPTV